MSFFQENVLLIGLALGSGIALIWPMLSGGAAGAVAISVTEAVLLMSRNKPLVLDVRDEAEFAQGYIASAKNIPVANLAARVAELQKHQDKPVLVYCQSGMRAKTACAILKGQQFSQLRVLSGGLNAWQEANMPVEKTPVKSASVKSIPVKSTSTKKKEA